MIYVSLTSIPSRLNNLTDIFECLNNQTVLPDCVIINYPYFSLRLNETYPILLLDDIQKSVKYKIYINRCYDYGPITKIYPLLDINFINPDDKIIIIDDDNYYNLLLIENLVDDFNFYNQKNVICVSGLLYPTKKSDTYKVINNGHKCQLIEASFGYIIKRSFINDHLRKFVKIFNNKDEIKENHFENIFYSDDYVISRFFDFCNINKYVIKSNQLINRMTVFQKKLDSNNSLCSMGHNLDKYLNAESDLKNLFFGLLN